MARLNFEHGGNIYKTKKKNIIDFSANINPLGLPDKIKNAIISDFNKVLHYPDPDATELTGKIAGYWKIPKENILVGNGSTELIYLIARTFKPETCFMPQPTFSEYERACRIGGSATFKNPSDIAFLCNPNNPTGELKIKNRALPENIKSKIYVIDETFMDFLPDEKLHTFIPTVKKKKNIVVLRTFTKFFALPGLRIGYLTAHKDLVNKIKDNSPPWNTNFIAQKAAAHMINDGAYRKRTIEFVEKERNFLLKEIQKINGLNPFSSVTNFILIKIEKKNTDSKALRKRLEKRNILIRDCGNFRGLNNEYIRIAVRAREENRMLIKILKEFF